MAHLFESAVLSATEWVDDVQRELFWADERKVYLALRIVLQTLRDRLPPEEAAQLAAELPALIRGVYYEGYNPTGKPLPIRSPEEFYHAVRERSLGRLPAEEATRGVLAVLQRKVSEGEVRDILATLPERLKGIWGEAEA